MEIGKDLVAHYSTVPEYRALLARCCGRLANVARASGKLLAAADDLAKAVELNKRLAAEFASVPIYRFFLVRSLRELAEVQIELSRWPQARATLDEEIACLTKVQEQSPPGWHGRRMLASQYDSLARVLRELGEKSQADAAAAKAEEAGLHRGAFPGGSFHHAHGQPLP